MDLITAYGREQTRRGLQATTITTRRRILWSLESFLGRDARDASPPELDAWLDTCRLSERSRYTYLSAAACWFTYLRQHGHRADNPCDEMARPKLPRLVPRPAPESDWGYAMGQADDRMHSWLALIAYQGFRCVEIARLRREDVLETHAPPLLVIQKGKGGHQAVLPLNAEVERQLRVWGLSRRGFLYVQNDGHPFSPGTVSRYIGKYLRSVGVEATAHQGRHLYGTMVYRHSRDVFVTQQMLRHADPRSSAGYVQWDTTRATDVVRELKVDGFDRNQERLELLSPAQPTS